MKKPILSVCIITYNHAEYIREAVDSILAQETDFAWELVVADDFSTDGTREILLDYQDQHPNRVKLILQKKNVGAENNWLDLINYPTTKYMLYGEGDDYFTDVNKLQKQLNFMESNSSYSLCFHPVKVVFQQKDHKSYVHPGGTSPDDFTLDELLNQNYIQTNSVMYRRQDYKHFPRGVIPGDWYLHLMHAAKGEIGFLPDVMSVYRRHSGGLWWGALDKHSDFWSKYAMGHLKLYQEIAKLFGNGSHDDAINRSLARFIGNIIDTNSGPDNSGMVQKIFSEYPDLAARYLIFQAGQANSRNREFALKEDRIAELYHAIELKNNHIDNLEKEISSMHESLIWRLGSRLVSPARKLRQFIKRR